MEKEGNHREFTKQLREFLTIAKSQAMAMANLSAASDNVA